MPRSAFAFLFFLTWTITGIPQQLPDPGRLSKMTPSELQAFKQQTLKQASVRAKQLSTQYNLKIDETMLPDFEVHPPVKDLKRLALLPLSVPSMAELSSAVRQSKQQLEQLAPAPVVQEVKSITAQQNGAQLQSSSVGQWLNDKPVLALLLSMESALKSPGEVAAWNNLAALYNMTGIEHMAIPILRVWLEKMPDNALLLNNMGQAYLGLGDLSKASAYLRSCLTVDSLNPEANHSLGMIAVFNDKAEEAIRYFSCELEVAYRRSTIAQIKRMGRNVNLLQLRRKRTGLPHRDLFEEISLSKFRIPPLPQTAEETGAWKAEKAMLLKNLQAEFIFWLDASTLSRQEQILDGKENRGLYADLANQLLSEHGDEYAPLLGLIRDDDVGVLTSIGQEYYNRLQQTPCPQPPLTPGGGEDLAKAYAKKCCSLHTPIVNSYMSEHNGFIQNRLNLTIANWKSYINGWVDIAQLNPNNAAKKGVYKVVADYFGFLISNLGTAVAEEPLPSECLVKMTEEEADSIIASKHDIELNCPPWLNLSLDLSAIKLKADCSKYSIEGGEGVLGGYEKNFKTGTSTLSIGVGVKASFSSLVKANAAQMVYVSFDNNNQFSDFGVKGIAGAGVGYTTNGMVTEVIGKVGTVLGGVDGGYTLGLNSGFKATLTGKGLLKDFINLQTKKF